MYFLENKFSILYYFDMSNKPDRLTLLPYQNHLSEAAKRFDVSERTIRRWLDEFGLYHPKKGWGRGKLNQDQVCEIRELYQQEKCTQAQLAEMFNVTQAMICRIVNNVSHRTALRLSGSAEYRYSSD